MSFRALRNERRGSCQNDANAETVSARLKRGCGAISCWAMA